MDDLIVEFITETNEGLQQLDTDLLKLEQNPNDKDLISKIFRLMHTIKGTCGFLGLPRLETCAHRAENVMGRFRDGDLLVTPEYVSLILESLDRVRFLLGHIEANGTEPEGNDNDLTEKLDAVYEGRDAAQQAAPAAVEAAAEAVSKNNADEDALQALFDSTPVLPLDQILAMENPPKEEQPEPVKEEPVKTEALKVETPKAEPPKADNKPAAASGNSDMGADSLRVNVRVLENLMTMVSELVLTRNQLLQILRSQKESSFSSPLQRLNHVVSDLQDGVMKTRMQPIGNAWAKLPRIIRDLSIELGKKVDLVMVGQDTELDRQVLEMIKDPLTHMVRNSADHGVEMPADRVKAGKPETGTVTLRAFHEGGHIIIEIADDGKGLATDRIKKKVLENGLATESELAAMTTQQIQQFIFRAGFSTAEKVTSVSGRGVGMDVVRTNIEKIGGSIELKSTEGKGSTFTIKIPLTLAIVSALIVESGKERFAIPQLSVRELVLVSPKSEHKIEMIKGTPVFRLRDKLLPLIPLEDLLQINETSHQNDVSRFHHKYIIVTQVGNYTFGIIVDKVFDTEEIVVKPVAKILKHIELFSGNTILGDGSVIMILDPGGLAKASGDTAVNDTQKSGAQDVDYSDRRTKTSLLLFRAGDDAPKAVPLALVARLEDFDMADIERAGEQYLIQYRERLMPLLPFSPSINMTSGKKPVLVFADRGQSIGLIVDEIIDITEEFLDIQVNSERDGFVGSTIIADHATDIIDVGFYLQRMNKNWFKNHGDEDFQIQEGRSERGLGKRRVLLVDDSPFFRNMLTPLLGASGYDVTSVESAADALNLAERGAHYDIIISDIEMPGMSGFELAAKLKSDSPWSKTPLVALSSHATPADMDRGQRVGFNKYVAKFDRETLLNTLTQALSEGDHA